MQRKRCDVKQQRRKRGLCLHFSKKDAGISLLPWTLFYFFLTVCLFLLLFQQNIHISSKYLVQDSLAAAALAGEVADLKVLSTDKELVITDLDHARTVFEESLAASLHLDAAGYPLAESVYLDSRMPVTIETLKIFNVSKGVIYETDLLQAFGNLEYKMGVGLQPDSRSRILGSLLDQNGRYTNVITMLDGEQKEIRTTSLYAKIRFGVRGFQGDTIAVEKDIMTDIQENK